MADLEFELGEAWADWDKDSWDRNKVVALQNKLTQVAKEYHVSSRHLRDTIRAERKYPMLAHEAVRLGLAKIRSNMTNDPNPKILPGGGQVGGDEIETGESDETQTEETELEVSSDSESEVQK